MSSILKALKKLEDDNTTRWPGEHKIDAEIVRPDNPPRLSPTILLLTSLLLLAGGSGATYMYMKRGTAPEPANQASTARFREHTLSASSASDVKTELLPATPVVVPAQQQSTAKKETSKRHQQTVSTRTVAAPKPAQSVLASSQKSPSPSLPASVKEVPVLRVNGIASQDGGAGSVAMINGEPFLNGAVIDGVKIEGIYKNKVGFSYNGESFEIQLGQSNR